MTTFYRLMPEYQFLTITHSLIINCRMNWQTKFITSYTHQLEKYQQIQSYFRAVFL
jgi:hypothetical protein